MTWETFYGTCFVVGLLLSVFSFVAGAAHLHFHGGAHVDFGGHGHAHMGGNGGNGGIRIASIFNFSTITAFLAWFGGTGLLITRYASLWTLLTLTLAATSGIAAAYVVFWFFVKVLLPHDRAMNQSDYDMIGVLGNVSSTIREKGTGEIIFSQEGTRRSAAARSESGAPIARGTEVVVTQYQRGIAYVRPFEEMSREASASQKNL